ncbi:MAG: CPBP family intramembrane glutamic endopeptidase [Bacteroidota bacterium]
MHNLFFLNNNHPHYNQYNHDLSAKSTLEKCWVIFAYLLPGIVFTILVNIKWIHDSLSGLFSLSANQYQFWLLILLTFGWHMLYPVLVLRLKRKYSWKEIMEALSLDQFSVKGFFLITPLFFALVLLLGVPYMKFAFPLVHNFLQSIDWFAIPEHSVFYDYSKIYGFASWQLTLLFIGNFVGEEIYFRGYLMKRSAFLGKHNWWGHSILFSLYHFWQIPMTYALAFIALSFGLFMMWRKNLYELMLLHFMINLFLPIAVQVVEQYF